MTSQVIISWTETTITRCSVGRQSVRKYRWTVHRWNWADHWQTWAPTLTYQVSVCDPLPSSLAAPAATAPTSSTGCCSVTSPDDSSRSPATHATTCQSGFPQLRQNKIPQLFPITLKYFQAFRGAIYNSNWKCWLHENSLLTYFTMTSLSAFLLTGSSLPYTSPITYKNQLIDKQVTKNVTCHKKSLNHISNSLTFPGLQNSLTISGFPGLWEPCQFIIPSNIS